MSALQPSRHGSQMPTQRGVASTMVCSVLLVGLVTLFPFDFVFRVLSLSERIAYFQDPVHLDDVAKNILLFLPFGFSLTWMLLTKVSPGLANRYLPMVALGGSASLSLGVEFLQISLESRASSIADVLANSAGGFLGSLCFLSMGRQVIQCAIAFVKRIQQALSIRILIISLIGYTILVGLFSLSCSTAATLQNWDDSFPLILGNEGTGDRPWQGSIDRIAIADHAASAQDIQTLFDRTRSQPSTHFFQSIYQLSGQGNYPDQTGFLQDLTWQGTLSNAHHSLGAFTAADHWLSTETPVARLTQRIRKRNQFTIDAIFRIDNITQTGPARIVSLSKDPYQRNFTLAQQGKDLVMRLRTPLTEENGANPELNVSNVLTQKTTYHLVITYNGSVLELFINGLTNRHAFELSSGIKLLRYFVPIHVTTHNLMSFRLLFYNLFFIPLGIILVSIVTTIKGKNLSHLLALGSGVIVTPLIVEGILATGGTREIRLDNLLLSSGLTIGTLLIVLFLIKVQKAEKQTLIL